MVIVTVDALYTETAAVDNDEYQPVLKKSTTDFGSGEYIYSWLICVILFSYRRHKTHFIYQSIRFI